MKLQLFSTEVEELVKTLPKDEPKVNKTPKKRTPRAKSTEDLSVLELKWKITEEKDELLRLEAQDETNFSDFDKSVKGKEVNMKLVNNHISYYQGFIDKQRANFEPILSHWKGFIVDLCKEKGQEIDKIWFDESVPYDCAIDIRLVGHRCWSSCCSFRFQEGKLKAFDSHFGGGTSFVWFCSTDYLQNPDCERDKVKEVMEKVFNKECSDSSWENNEDREEKHREINIDEKGWLI
jgi:hypothetical protein